MNAEGQVLRDLGFTRLQLYKLKGAMKCRAGPV